MAKREEYLALMEKQLNEWKAKTEPFKASAEQWEAQMKAQYEKNLEALQAKRDEAWERLSTLKSASDDAWDQVKANMDKAWEDLKESTEKLTNLHKK
ncbi:MAG: hypothetical protein CVU19_07025 [Betaproteobacteria bacterium HGW-Betaproteobacteria-13]|jgi:DNA repair ATPase RecN|uniref:Coiled coil domain-containing protein n=1 Tax=Parazoarcus communis TaxID=41977 RepID=A0A2U8H5W7_9RHOO|nr:hypothetical protein [Parazoarcus communis]AWI81043.1 hypothetical protein CEW87_17735 [Parazoarcus communis]PKO53633.1 MAG: hypothetical protein CVU28_09240 [Betaproteobacteria bacterium HGW-Betaproteobacteria-21]PKO81428.1 MAG: hypothetical protein CVU19_07025 [Betaproteobacteria bacterium HGW-Betaproteobacteria-13]